MLKPVDSWTRDPFKPTLEGDKLYGLGSNDCGGGLTTLLQVFRWLSLRPQPYNYIYLASAEEEVSGKGGFSRAYLRSRRSMSPSWVSLQACDRPSQRKASWCLTSSRTARADTQTRNEGVNAIYEALDDMVWIRDYKFQKVSPLLGPTKMTLTVVHAGTQDNVIPDLCTMLVDVRTNEYYTNEEVFDIIKQHVKSEVHAHSFRLHSSHIDPEHPLIKAAVSLGLKPYGSPTLSDQALMPWQSFKLGPGESSRSHSADEYICISEMRNAFYTYLKVLE